MNRSKQTWLLSSIALIVFLTACITLSPDTTDETVIMHETAVVAVSTSVAQTMTAVSTSTVIPTTIVPTTLSTPTPTTTPLPDFEPTQIPGLLSSALTVETLSGLNGHDLQHIIGWKYGFHRLEWLDANHLMLYPFAGVTNAVTDRTVAGTYPAVINLDSKKFWIPYLDRVAVDGRASFPWSPQLGMLILPGPKEVSIYSPDGDLMDTYAGTLLGVSPSATKLLIDGDTWIDLSSGKTVHFGWSQTEMAINYIGFSSFRPIWSPDETRVYTCCYLYGDAKTGESLAMPYYDVPVKEEKEKHSLDAFYGTWVLNGKYMLPIWGGAWDGRPNWISLFDPATKSYRNLSAEIGLPFSFANLPDPYCNRPSAQNGGRYVWVACQDGGHLIDLATFHSQEYAPIEDGSPFGWLLFADVEWSADGNFAWLHGDRNGIERILSATNKDLKIPQVITDKVWHPTESKLVYLSDDGRTLLMLDPGTSVQKEIALPAQFYKFTWSSDGKHIALVDANDSVWRVDYPRLDNFEQLTFPLSQLVTEKNDSMYVENLIWSPDNTALAFSSAGNIYIVAMDSKP